MRINSVRRLVLAMAASTALCTAAMAEPVTLTIVHFNDFDRMEDKGGQGGMAKLAAVVKEARAEYPNVLVTFGGDAISPSLMSASDKGAHMIDLFNKLGVSAATLGNHEFDFGPEVIHKRIGEAKFPMMGSNILDADGTLFDGLTDTLMYEYGPYKVGVFGVTTSTTPTVSSPGKDVMFKNEIEVSRAKAAELRKAGANLVMALTHMGVVEDAALLQDGAVDVILSGHDHDLRLNYNGKVALVESASQADFVTKIELVLDTVKSGDKEKFVWWPSSFLFQNTLPVTADPEMAAEVKVYLDQLSKDLDIEIGMTTTEMDSRRAVVRGQEAAIGNLIADGIRASTKADVAITNGGGIRADKQYVAGATLTRRDIQRELPFGNRTILIELTGADIKAALENGVAKVEEGVGQFPQVSNIAFTYDAAKPAGSRVVEVKVGGAPLDEAKTYKLATNDFMGKGGDNYTMFVGKKRLIDDNASAFMATEVMDYIAEQKTVSPKVEGRIVRLN
jgi:5'-nucleotidase / UDP-sugar diphosphatase